MKLAEMQLDAVRDIQIALARVLKKAVVFNYTGE